MYISWFSMFKYVFLYILVTITQENSLFYFFSCVKYRVKQLPRYLLFPMLCNLTISPHIWNLFIFFFYLLLLCFTRFSVVLLIWIGKTSILIKFITRVTNGMILCNPIGNPWMNFVEIRNKQSFRSFLNKFGFRIFFQ